MNEYMHFRCLKCYNNCSIYTPKICHIPKLYEDRNETKKQVKSRSTQIIFMNTFTVNL